MTTVVIMPGGFHPFHAGHLALYQSAQRAFPDAEVYVAATNDTSARPFPFPVKEKLAKLAGVEPGHFVQVKSPFRAEEITAKFDPDQDTLIFVRSEKDADKPPQAGGVKRDGSPSYLQPLLGAKKLEPFSKHAYMAYLPTVEFGPGMTSATQIRTAWPTLDERRKTALVMSLYPRTQGNAKLAATVVRLLDAAIGSASDVAEGQIQYGVLDHANVNLIIDKSESKPDGVYSFRGILFKVKGGKVTHWATDGKILQAMGRFNTQIGSYATNAEARTILKGIKEDVDENQGWAATLEAVAEGTDGWIGNPAKWKEAVLQAHGDDVVFKNYSHPGQPGKRSVNAINAAGKQVGVYQRHNKMGMVQPNQQGVEETVSANGTIANTSGSGAGMTASYQRRDNQPISEDYLDERRL